MTNFIVSFEDGRDAPTFALWEQAFVYAAREADGGTFAIGRLHPDGRVVMAGCEDLPTTGPAISAIGVLVDAGREDLARRLVGDQAVADWIRGDLEAQGLDADAVFRDGNGFEAPDA